ncbi:hypothetical protein HOP50_05g35640 [Chloropicon primus]|uniref:AIR9-like A9 domain-containing protein n=1 Tax=Chloropicon primus TaxID=1764295 RepID=A0A5B8MKW8_9CHLO|nr:hypothetical protein A3770_05p35570 [Chloropicon primus]UPR00250.1 hypothetical protein HOP50_05g35640 [Chloropicon primus]|eukprot:QDZ21039.1 hypothetical protein A3770_05p35570 [Chloropicon primus]
MSERGSSPVNGVMQQNGRFVFTPAPTLSGASPMSSLKSPGQLKTQVQTWSKIIDVAEREIERKGKEMQGLKARLRSVEWEALSRAREVSTLSDKLKEVEYKLAEKETQVKTILSGLDVRDNQEKNLDQLISLAIEDKVTWEKRYRSAVNELELKTQYLDDKENFWFSEIQDLENRIQEKDDVITGLKGQLLGLRKMQESGSLAAFGRQSAALKERSSLIHGQSDLSKKLGEAVKKTQYQKQQIESLEVQLQAARSENSVYTSALLPLLEDSGLFLQSANAQEIAESVKALIDALMAELRIAGKDKKVDLNTRAAKELLSIKEKTLESQQKQTKLLKELEFTTREAEKLTRAIMDDDEPKAEDRHDSADQETESESGAELELELDLDNEEEAKTETEAEEESLRRDRSATLIQSKFRGFQAKKKYKEMHDVQTAASRVIQKHYRSHQKREDHRQKDKAITTIQAGARRWKVQKEVKAKRNEEASILKDEVLERAAKTLQAHERARQSRKKYNALRTEREEKAVTIQKHFRSKKAKKILKQRKENAPAVEDFGIFCNDRVLSNGSVIRACGRPCNGTTLCMFQWTRRDDNGEFQDIRGATTPEYTLSPDDIGKVVGVRCTPTNDRDEVGLPAKDIVNEGNPIGMTEEMTKEITNISMKGTATFHAQLVKFGKSTIPTTVTITVDKKQVTISKKEKVLLKIKYESLPVIRLLPENPTLCPVVMTEGNDKGKEVSFLFSDVTERDNTVILMRHLTNQVANKPKKSFLSFLSRSKSKSTKSTASSN